MVSADVFRLKVNATRGPVITAYDPIIALGSKLKAYWDAADEGTSRVVNDGGGLISSWTSRVGALTLTAATTARPTLTTAYFSGRKAFLFDGVANRMRMTGMTGIPSGANPSRIWMLYNTVGTSSALTFLMACGGTAGGTQRRLGRSNASNRFVVSDATVNTNGADSFSLIVGPNMSCGHWAGTSQDGRNRGGVSPAAIAIATLNTGTTSFTVGASNAAAAASFVNAAISVIMVTDGTETLDEMQHLESWGYREGGDLTALPDDHPYKDGPDDTTHFSPAPTLNIIRSAPGTSPFHLDFRLTDFDQIKTYSPYIRSKYDISGNRVEVPSHTAAWFDYHPITHEPLGLSCFSGATIFNVGNRTLASPSVFTFTASGQVSEWFDGNVVLCVYGLGVGSIRLQFGQPVEILRADGTSEEDWGLPAITTSDIEIDMVLESSGDPALNGWFNGVHRFKMPRDNPTTVVTMSKVGGSTVVYAEAARTVPGPPTASGNRATPHMYSSFAATGLPQSPTSFTFCLLNKTSHCTQGGQWLTIDDNDLNNTVAPLNHQPVRRLAMNYLQNPRFDDGGRKSGFMGITYATGTATEIANGQDPQTPVDIVRTERMKTKSFFGTGNWLTGECCVCVNGSDVERGTFTTLQFPDKLKMVRWMGSYAGGLTTDGWLLGVHLEHANYYDADDATIKAFCDPTNADGIFGIFDPT